MTVGRVPEKADLVIPVATGACSSSYQLLIDSLSLPISWVKTMGNLEKILCVVSISNMNRVLDLQFLGCMLGSKTKKGVSSSLIWTAQMGLSSMRNGYFLVPQPLFLLEAYSLLVILL